MNKPAIILLSGGLDSATTLALAVDSGFTPYALSFDYGQRHRHELLAAQKLAHHYNVARHVTMKIDLRAFGHSALTDDIPVPKDHLAKGTDESQIPVTYVPARNTVFLSFALAYAETTNAFDIFLGVNAIDYSGYPDCRPAFIAAFQNLANLATKSAVESAAHSVQIHAPLIHMSKAEIIQAGLKLNVPYHLTHSCYDPTSDGKSCGHCDSCLLRLAGFKEAGATDPISYTP
jgi:7-cyano-7-deazaguanine synthase